MILGSSEESERKRNCDFASLACRPSHALSAPPSIPNLWIYDDSIRQQRTRWSANESATVWENAVRKIRMKESSIENIYYTIPASLCACLLGHSGPAFTGILSGFL